MTDIVINRHLSAAPERVFEFITSSDKLLTWWGPEAMDVPEHKLDFSRQGGWYSVMRSKEGGRFKVSGDVTNIEPPKSVTITWAWHDEDDQRGHESQVVFEVTANGSGADLTIRHTGLEKEESMASHKEGWISTLNKLEGVI